MEPLASRHEMILRAIVFEYVSTAEPVGSDALVAKYPLGIKGASVRSAMSEMLDRGILAQPHTSAGRIPSDAGYRYYVDNLLQESPANPQAQSEVQAALREPDALSEMMRAALIALSRLTRQLAVGATIGNTSLTVRTAVVSAMGPKQALFVLALSNGHVETKMLECPAHLTLDEIGRINDVLTHQVLGQNLRNLLKLRLRGVDGREGGAEGLLLTAIGNALRESATQLSRGKLLLEGEPYVFSQPEFAGEAAALTTLIEELTSGEELAKALTSDPELLQPRVQGSTVTIGREHASEHLHRFSVVRAGFSAGPNDAGVIAVIGPTRMSYETTMPAVQTTASVLSRSLARFFSGQ